MPQPDATGTIRNGVEPTQIGMVEPAVFERQYGTEPIHVQPTTFNRFSTHPWIEMFMRD